MVDGSPVHRPRRELRGTDPSATNPLPTEPPPAGTRTDGTPPAGTPPFDTQPFPAQPYGAPAQPYGTPAQPYGTPAQPYTTSAQPYGTSTQPYGPPPAGGSPAGGPPADGPAAQGPGGSGPGGTRPGGRPRITRRTAFVAAGCVAVLAVAVGILGRHSGGTGDAPTPAPSARPSSAASGGPSGSAPGTSAAAAPGWLSGASSNEAASGAYGTWRGTAIAVGGTWDNGNAEQVAMSSICPGGPWAQWDKPLDVAVGAIDVTQGETWAAAARGAYTARWTKNLNRIKECWGSRDPANLYIRFAHEMNLGESKWRVRGGEEPSFVKAITLYSTLRYQILPTAKVVLCPNDGTESEPLGGLDIRKLWPGKDGQGRPVADVYGVDSYNMNPHVNTTAEFTKKINDQYANGMPLGLEKHRQFAESVGAPFAVGEWSNNGDPANAGGGGESPLYVQEFYRWAASHAGDLAHPTPGQLVYEVQFNLWDQYAFWPKTDQPRTAAAYRALHWGKVS